MRVIMTSGSLDYLRDTGTRRYWDLSAIAREVDVRRRIDPLNARIAQERSRYRLPLISPRHGLQDLE